jgi:hypothetical protein
MSFFMADTHICFVPGLRMENPRSFRAAFVLAARDGV